MKEVVASRKTGEPWPATRVVHGLLTLGLYLLLGPTATVASGPVDSEAAFTFALSEACTAAASQIASWEPAKLEADQAATTCIVDQDGLVKPSEECRAAILSAWETQFRTKIGGTLRNLHRDILERTAAEGDRLARLQVVFDQEQDAVSAAVARRNPLRPTDSDLKKKIEELPSTLPLREAILSALPTFKAECSVSLTRAAQHFNSPLQRDLRRLQTPGIRELEGRSTFARVVNCIWTEIQGPRLDCSPSLLLTGQNVSDIMVKAPPGSTLTRVMAVTAERRQRIGRANFGPFATGHTQPWGEWGPDETELREAVVIGIHGNRSVAPTWRQECSSNNDPHCRDRVLTLIVKGRAPRIHIVAESEGRRASGEVTVGYERWRFETGGFMAVSWLLDEELVTAPHPINSDRRIVDRVRKVDQITQETGVFLNFIPRHFELVGISLGFALSDQSAPKVFLGPTIRMRTFGEQGLAAFTVGAILGSVRRFPDIVECGATDPAERAQCISYSLDNTRLEGREQFRMQPYVGIQLGFSFGPISVPGDSR